MKRQNAAASQPKQSQAAESLMAMGKGKKMMGQMGQRGGPMEMMQKMMAQTSQGGGKAPMEKMMGMCSDVMTSMRQTNALAVHASAELQQVFGDWLKQVEDKALGLLAKGAVDSADLARSLNISEDSARYVLYRLAASDRITLAGKVNRQLKPDGKTT